MISIPAPDKNSQQKPLRKKTKFRMDALVWQALCMIAMERKKTPEEMITIWVNRYIEHKEKIEQEQARQENNNGIIIP